MAKDITEPETEEEKAAWDQVLMPVRKRFDNFEDPHGYYRILCCRKLLSDEEVDSAFKRQKKTILSILRNSYPDKLRAIPDKEMSRN